MNPPSKKFRISGIAVFVVLTLLIGVFFVLFLDGIIKDTIEDRGSRIMKSQIDVGSLSTSLLSQSVDIGKLQIANGDKLDENLVQAGRIKFDFDGNRALSKKVIIDDMKLEGLRLNQKREVPAKPYKPAREKSEAGAKSKDKSSTELGMPQGLDFKNPKDILKNETLETLEIVEKTKGDLEALKTKWQTQVDQQLSQESLAQIQQRVKDLQAKSKNLKDPRAIQSIMTEIQSLRNDIQTRIDTVQNFKKNLETDIRHANTLASQIKDLPQKDFDRLRKKYSLDLKGGTGLISKMVSGPLKVKIDKAWGYYKQISPYLKSDSKSKPKPEKMERGKGQFIKFSTPNPFPDFLIRQAKLSMNVWDQDVEGGFQGLT
ncbi:MAG: TIGR03545 family protein, partial [Nitrospinota bacterium]|nr:TIGR03545 family protein [Nitrospinota bacterium]